MPDPNVDPLDLENNKKIPLSSVVTSPFIYINILFFIDKGSKLHHGTRLFIQDDARTAFVFVFSAV